eukprot:2645467-Amphidinium_carterae.1
MQLAVVECMLLRGTGPGPPQTSRQSATTIHSCSCTEQSRGAGLAEPDRTKIARDQVTQQLREREAELRTAAQRLSADANIVESKEEDKAAAHSYGMFLNLVNHLSQCPAYASEHGTNARIQAVWLPQSQSS